MRSTHPDDRHSESEYEDDAVSYGVNGSIDEDDNDDTYDFKSVDSRPWDERSAADRLDDVSFPDKVTRETLSQMWGKEV